MPLVAVTAPADQPPHREVLVASYADHLAVTGRGSIAYTRATRAFLRRWPDPQDWAGEPLEVRLSLNASTWSFVMFLMVHRLLPPGWD